MLGIDSDQARVNLFMKKRGRIYSVKYMQFYLRAEYFESLVVSKPSNGASIIRRSDSSYDFFGDVKQKVF